MLITLFSLVLTGCDLSGGAGTDTETAQDTVAVTESADTGTQADVQTDDPTPPPAADMFTADARRSLQELQVQIEDENTVLGTAYLVFRCDPWRQRREVLNVLSE